MPPTQTFADAWGCPAFPDDPAEMATLSPAVPAATLVIFDESEQAAPPRLLMVARSDSLAFAAGKAVFPGGKVDAGDVEIARALHQPMGLSLADAASRVAAIRETLEETGLPVGLIPRGHIDTPPPWSSIRAALHEGDPFADLLHRHNLDVNLAPLVPFARWRPNHALARVFDTRFYLTRMDGATQHLSVSEGESTHLFWDSAAQILSRAAAGELAVIFPTLRNLERLAGFPDYASAVESARAIPAMRITPFREHRPDGEHLCIRDDCGYPVTSQLMGSVSRG